MRSMAIFKASSYTRTAAGAKASIRYIAHRPGKDNAKITRTLWGSDGKMERTEAYRMIDDAENRSYFYRLIISPDPEKEETYKDIYLREITEHTMGSIEERIGKQIQWVAATHADHAPNRHIHIVAILPRRLERPDLHAVREFATEAALDQRHQRDAALERTRQQEKGVGWER